MGMTRLEMEMFPTALVLSRSRAEESATRAALLECAGGFSPRVEDQSSDSYFTCVIDIAGTETLFGSPDTLGESLLKKIQALRIQASIAISSNFHAARCLARGHSCSVQDTGDAARNGTRCARAFTSRRFSIFPRNTRRPSPCGASRHSEHWRISQETELISRLGQPGKEMRRLARGTPHLFRCD